MYNVPGQCRCAWHGAINDPRAARQIGAETLS